MAVATVEDFIYSRLQGLVGGRAYRVRMPDNPVFPAVTFENQFADGEESFDGDSRLYHPVIALHAWSKSAGEAQRLANQCRDALLGFKGQFQDLVVQNVLNWSHVDLYDFDTEVFHAACSCRVWYYAQ